MSQTGHGLAGGELWRRRSAFRASMRLCPKSSAKATRGAGCGRRRDVMFRSATPISPPGGLRGVPCQRRAPCQRLSGAFPFLRVGRPSKAIVQPGNRQAWKGVVPESPALAPRNGRTLRGHVRRQPAHGGNLSTLEPPFSTNPRKWLVFAIAFLRGIVYNSTRIVEVAFAGSMRHSRPRLCPKPGSMPTSART